MYISISEHVIQIRKIFYPFYTIEEYLRREKSGILLAILQNNQLEVIFYFQKNLFIGNHINMIYISFKCFIGNHIGSLKSSFVLQGKECFIQNL